MAAGKTERDTTDAAKTTAMSDRELVISRSLGAILLTGYLGGAVATHVRVGVRSSATSCSRSMSQC